MTADVIEIYDTFNTKGFPEELILGNFNGQPIPKYYYNFLNNENDDGNNFLWNQFDDDLPENEGMEYAIIPNDE